MKKMICGLLTFLMCIALSACSPSTPNPTIDITKVGEEIIAGVKFDDALTPTDKSNIDRTYEFTNVEKAIMYIGSGATAEEVSLFEFKTDKDASNAHAIAEQHIKDQKEAFLDYVPAEIQRLDKAIIKVKGKYLVVCVSGDAKSGEIINKYFN
ncbi:MAG: DUF4358 domain-containing protein [Clostridia bacterium]